MTIPAPCGVITQNDGAVILALAGELDLATAPEARALAALAHDEAAAGARKLLVIDLRAITFLASMGLELLADQRSRAARTGVAIALVATTRAVTRVLDIAGLTAQFVSCADVESALTSSKLPPAES
ncbi:STAS domain-containing protein [Amycolatopsis sp. OK19-0408]|uniref:Anti-sigma factor antagonist n=1 Tax=Amycolatopsis iheyensis TaxID=2945988 RepID=A0A9X2NMZ4_9PSEU|nr:STAS domain-containing protein [Amycolatopsis iheyensis]MCR6490761.1 STAS domain-containing protein [Amycolatopsis iheyensis]